MLLLLVLRRRLLVLLNGETQMVCLNTARMRNRAEDLWRLRLLRLLLLNKQTRLLLQKLLLNLLINLVKCLLLSRLLLLDLLIHLHLTNLRFKHN